MPYDREALTHARLAVSFLAPTLASTPGPRS